MSDLINLKTKDVFIEGEMKEAYLSYAMTVIVGRALPNCSDGLKPVHRRIIYAMFKEGLLSNKKHSKSMGVVGEVLKKYHPHGDSSVYGAMARLTQDWNLRYPLIEGQGNFGSFEGDNPAAARYTEARMSKISEKFLVDIEKEAVDFMDNYDATTKEPKVLPTLIPNLLINGSSGIAVGMATNIPPHNLGEIVDCVIKVIDEPNITNEDLVNLNIVKGPDFPTGATILQKSTLLDFYKTGEGSITMKAVISIENISKKKKH